MKVNGPIASYLTMTLEINGPIASYLTTTLEVNAIIDTNVNKGCLICAQICTIAAV